MIHIDVSDVRKTYGGQSVLRGLSFSVTAGEHVGLVGANGAGKTTLLKILTGSEQPDSGHVAIPAHLRVGILSQLPVYQDGVTASDVLRRAFLHVQEAERELRALETAIAAGDESVLKRYGELSHEYEFMGGFETELELSRICNGLNLEPALLERGMSKLSGGEQTRINLARLLLERTALLLLDEPTNHLDLRACEWLEDYLGTFKGTVLAVSHDRYFLDRFAHRIIELDDGKAAFYSGNYSFYADEREARRLERQRAYDKEKREHDKLAAAARQMHDWAGKNQKLHRRAFAMEKRAARILKTEKPKTEKKLKGSFESRQFEADDIFRLQELCKSFGNRVILDNLSHTMRKGERIALLGDNGTGKSTLLKILTGELPPDGGKIWFGPSVKWGYLPQKVEFAHPERNLVDTLLYELDVTPAEARNRLAAFHFTGDKVFDAAGALSGGERSRLTLCMLMARNVNLLLLDEPTNHLDIDSREWIESALDDFTQAILFVSHDRYFIEQFATRVWWLENGAIWDVQDNYAVFRQALAAREKPGGSGTVKAAQNRTHEKETAPSGDVKLSPLARMRRHEQAVARLEKKIESVEASLGGLDVQIAESASDFSRLCELLEQQEQMQREREELYARYQELSETE